MHVGDSRLVFGGIDRRGCAAVAGDHWSVVRGCDRQRGRGRRRCFIIRIANVDEDHPVACVGSVGRVIEANRLDCSLVIRQRRNSIQRNGKMIEVHAIRIDIIRHKRVQVAVAVDVSERSVTTIEESECLGRIQKHSLGAALRAALVEVHSVGIKSIIDNERIEIAVSVEIAQRDTSAIE